MNRHNGQDAPGVKPSAGNMVPAGASNLKGFPSAPINESRIGLNDSSPAKDIAVTISGEARKFIVLLFPSLRLLKFLHPEKVRGSNLIPKE